MASTATDMQSGSLEQRREGVELLTKEQQFNTSILRLRVNSDDVLVHLGRVINDNFFDENLLDMDSSGAITSAPSFFAEKRTLGQSDRVWEAYTELTDFDPIVYLLDEGLVMFPTVLTAQQYADPVSEDATIGIFEKRSEISGFRFIPEFAKKGAKASICSTAEANDRLFYQVRQEVPRIYSESIEKYSPFFEAGDELSIIEFTTYQDQIPASSIAFVDDYDTSVSAKELLKTGDVEIANVILTGSAGSLFVKRDTISAAAGWTFLNTTNGTDSIVYSDRI